MKYLIDSNIIIAAITASSTLLRERLGMCDEDDIVTSAIVYAEVAHGSRHGKPPPLDLLNEFLQDVPVFPFDEAAGCAYASLPFLRASYDRLIAAHPLSRELIVVTQNMRHFADVSGLRVKIGRGHSRAAGDVHERAAIGEHSEAEWWKMIFATIILTLYPEMFPGPLAFSLAGRALQNVTWSLDTIQIRDFATDKHRSVDDTPAGGGAGMVLRADVLAAAVDHVLKQRPELPMLAMSPRGEPLTQNLVRELAAGPGVSILCGRFEGIDERLFEARPIRPVSIGDYVLSGGETAAIVLLDACVRLLPGVMGAATSGEEESFEAGLLEYPHYTRPQMWEGRTIPEVLRSGDHAKIAAWRRAKAIEDTRLRRPDLIERHGDARRPSPSGAQHDD